jgi:glycine cleavage system aminomethyltransferase T
MAFINQDLAKEGNKLTVVQRNKKYKIGIYKMPFVASKYYKGWKDF